MIQDNADNSLIELIDVLSLYNLGLADLSERLITRFNGRLQPATPADAFKAARMAGFVISETINIMLRTERFAIKYKRAGYAIEGFDDLTTRRQKLIEIKNDFVKRWRLPDQQKIKKAKQELADRKFRVISGHQNTAIH